MSKIEPALRQKVAKFVELTGQFAEQVTSQLGKAEGKQQKLASAAPTLVDRCIQLELIDKHQKAAAVSMFSDPEQLAGIVDNMLSKFSEVKSDHAKLASLTQGSSDVQKVAHMRDAGASPFVGQRGQKSAADAQFEERILGVR